MSASSKAVTATTAKPPTTTSLPAVLTIAGSDSSGGAGIQADIKTMLMNGVFAMSAITALTAQNTTGVRAVAATEPAMLAGQIDAVFDDIPPAAVKIGMIPSAALVGTIADRLTARHAVHIVLDPVMVATSGAQLSADDAVRAMEARLLPLAEVITPNIPEAQVLSGMDIKDADGMERAAQAIARRYGCATLVKGGHAVDDADDVLCETTCRTVWFHGERVDNPNTHGTGCTLSSAIAANLAKGSSLSESIHRAKGYLSGALRAMLDLGHGSGPMDHAWMLRPGPVQAPPQIHLASGHLTSGQGEDGYR